MHAIENLLIEGRLNEIEIFKQSNLIRSYIHII